MAEGEEVKVAENNQDMSVYYVLGAIVLVAIIAAGYFLRPKQVATVPEPQVAGEQTAAPTATPTPGTITKLGCDSQYYNPVIGLPKYYLSAEGGDLPPATKVTCTFTASVDGQIVATESVSSPLTDSPQRGGGTFRCTTKGLELKADVPTKIDVTLIDDKDNTATCTANFSFPKN